jgi:hypothetical protein
MAVLVVDGLQPVDVGEDECHLLAVLAVRRDGLVEPVVEGAGLPRPVRGRCTPALARRDVLGLRDAGGRLRGHRHGEVEVGLGEPGLVRGAGDPQLAPVPALEQDRHADAGVLAGAAQQVGHEVVAERR